MIGFCIITNRTIINPLTSVAIWKLLEVIGISACFPRRLARDRSPLGHKPDYRHGWSSEYVRKSMHACQSVSAACGPAETAGRRGEIGSVRRSSRVGRKVPVRRKRVIKLLFLLLVKSPQFVPTSGVPHVAALGKLLTCHHSRRVYCGQRVSRDSWICVELPTSLWRHSHPLTLCMRPVSGLVSCMHLQGCRQCSVLRHPPQMRSTNASGQIFSILIKTPRPGSLTRTFSFK